MVPKFVGRDISEFAQNYFIKWLRKETAQDVLIAGEFPEWKISIGRIDSKTDYADKKGVLDFFYRPILKNAPTAK